MYKSCFTEENFLGIENVKNFYQSLNIVILWYSGKIP